MENKPIRLGRKMTTQEVWDKIKEHITSYHAEELYLMKLWRETFSGSTLTTDLEGNYFERGTNTDVRGAPGVSKSG